MRTDDVIKFQVTQADIESGIRDDANTCPIAIAFKREYSRQNVEVDDRGLSDIDNYGWKYDFPEEVSKWVIDFDAGEPVLPIEVRAEWNVPDWP